jgi:type IV pilus assembly protein PilX
MKPFNRNRQRGAVLIIALLFLTILTILGVTAMTATTFEEKMAGNTRDVALAFQAADAALRDARRDLNGIVIAPFNAPRNPRISGRTGFGDGTDVNNGTCGTVDKNSPPPWTLGLCRTWPYEASTGIQPVLNTTASLTASPSVEYGYFTGALMPAGLLSRKPRYIIEVLCYPPPAGVGSIGETFCNFYRVTAAGYGGNPNTQVTVQEIFLAAGP